MPEELNKKKTEYEKAREKIESLHNLSGFFINPLWMPMIIHLYIYPEKNSQNDLINGIKEIKKAEYVRVMGITLNALKKGGYLEGVAEKNGK